MPRNWNINRQYKNFVEALRKWKEYARRSQDIDFSVAQIVKLKREKNKTLHAMIWRNNTYDRKEEKCRGSNANRKSNGKKVEKKNDIQMSTVSILQLFVHCDVGSSPLVLQVSSQDAVSTVAAEISERYGVSPDKMNLYDERHNRLCPLLSFEDNGIIDEMNIHVKVVRGLLGGVKPEGATGVEENLPEDINQWKKQHIRIWLRDEVEVEDKYVEQLIDGGLTKISLVRYTTDKDAFDKEFKEIPRTVRRNIIDAWEKITEREILQQKHSSADKTDYSKPPQRRRSHSPVSQNSPNNTNFSATGHQDEINDPLALRRDTATPLSNDKTSKQSESQVKHDLAQKAASNVSKLQELFRTFDTDENCKYHRNCQLLPETGPDDLMTPCHEYKAFQVAAQAEKVTKQINFMKHLVKFACACLNERSNGTIHFGVGDDIEKDDKGKPKCKHGEILGIAVGENDRKYFTEWTEEAIRKCFRICNTKGKAVSPTDCDLSKCLRRPKFIPLYSAEMTQLFVVEVDIVPNSLVCEDYHFKVRAPTKPAKGGRIQFTQKYLLYRRIGASSEPANGKAPETTFVNDELPVKIKLRKDVEQQQAYKKVQSESLLDNEKKLTSFLLNGHRSIDDVYPILVCSRPDEHTNAARDLSFVAQLDCTVVFDFDVDSENHGLAGACKIKFEQGNIKYIRSYAIESEVFSSDKSTDKFCESLNFKNDVVWIYPNGHSKYNNEGNCDQPETAMSLQEWTEKRNRKIGDAIYMLSNAGVIPEHRASVMCILLNSDPESMKIMCECIHNLLVRFGLDKMFFIINNDRVRDAFLRHIGERYTKDKLEKRMIVGMPWSQVNKAIAHLRGYVPDNSCVVRFSNGGLCEIDIATQRRLKNITIVGVKQCDDKNMQNDEIFQQEEEQTFFNGEKASWWNFFFPGQVCRREIVDEYYYKIYHARYRQLEEYVYLMELKHQRGAGGSTVARNLLWELRKYFRCAEITEIDKDATNETAKQIFELYLYEEDNPLNCLPVFAVLDIECEDEVVNDLKNDLEELFRVKGARTPACILLHCSSKFNADACDIKQELSQGELKWFENKEEEMQQHISKEATGAQHSELTAFKSLNTMLGFQVLRHNFNFERIKQIVCSLVDNVKPDERNLLKFLALMQFYVNDCIPLPCCDAIMAPMWQRELSKEFEQLTVWYRGTISPNQRIVSSVNLLTISHYYVSKALLEDNEKLSQITSKFLQSNLLRSHSHARMILCKSATTMMKLRKDSDDKQSLTAPKHKFSEFITDIIERETPLMAAEILQECFEALTEFYTDPFLLQQAARVYYLKTDDFKEALRLAEKAIKVQGTPSSYLLDTKGQVYKEQLKHDFSTNQSSNWTIDDGRKIIDLSLKAMDVFKESLKAAKDEALEAFAKYERRKFNDAGLYGSLYITYDLIERLSQVEHIDLDVVKSYILNPNTEIPIEWCQYHSCIKRIKPYVDQLMEKLAERQLGANQFEELQATIDMRNKSYNDIKNKYKKYFGSSFPPSEADNPDISEQRRQNIRSRAISVCTLTGEQIRDNRPSAKVLGFANVFDLFQWFWIYYGKKEETCTFAIKNLREVRNSLQQNTPKSSYDLKMLIYINLFLANFEDNKTDTQAFYRETVDYCKEYFTKEVKNIYPASLMVMLMWPREDLPVPYDNALFAAALKRLDTTRDLVDSAKDTVQFYLGKGRGLQVFVQPKKLSHGSKFRVDRDIFWREKNVEEKVCRMKGYSSHVTQILANNVCNIREPILVHSKKALLRFSQEPGTFVLGFRKSGPIAFDWQETGKKQSKFKVI